MNRPAVLRTTPGELARRGVRAFRAAEEVVCEVGDVNAVTHPLSKCVLARFAATRSAAFEDARGKHRAISIAEILREAGGAIADGLRAPWAIIRHRRDLDAMSNAERPRRARRDPDAAPLFLRVDPWFGVDVGGSVAHWSGVVEAFASIGLAPDVVTTDESPAFRSARSVTVRRPRGCWNAPSALRMECDRSVNDAARASSSGSKRDRPGFIYARHALHAWRARQTADAYGVPLVLEYNGPEVWIGEQWGRGVAHRELAERAESFSLAHADLIAVVSDALRAELIAREVAEERIVVSPNGVDPERFRCDDRRPELRKDRGFGENDIVVVFVGSFGPWHGAEIFARAIAIARETAPEVRLRALFIGDGPRAGEARRALGGAEPDAQFLGAVPSSEIPAWLSASDIAVSPHLPNSDGSRFFGSPTKLFEYLAAGLPTIGSDLEQIAAVLSGGVGVLVPPAEPATLAREIIALSRNPKQRRALGERGRDAARNEHSWGRRATDLLAHLDSRTNDRASSERAID